MTNPHPNATAGGLGGALGVLIVWALGFAGLDISAEIGAAIATVTSALVLFIGRFPPFRQTEGVNP